MVIVSHCSCTVQDVKSVRASHIVVLAVQGCSRGGCRVATSNVAEVVQVGWWPRSGRPGVIAVVVTIEIGVMRTLMVHCARSSRPWQPWAAKRRTFAVQRAMDGAASLPE